MTFQGICYQTGMGVEQDLNEAIRLYRSSADQGNVNSQIRLGFLYQHGNGVEKNEEKAFKLYYSAARTGIYMML